MIDRRRWSAAMLGTLALPVLPAVAAAPPEANLGKVLRVAFESPETGFDPARFGDLYSNRIHAHIFESLYRYDLFAMPVKVRPLTAAAMPEVSADFRVWTVHLQAGIFFADDPAFKGKPRELVAADYAYTVKRFYDPANLSPAYANVEEDGIEGLEALRAAALRDKKPFDYDAPVEGLRVLDRYTLQFRLREARPRFVDGLCNSSSFGAVAREVVEFYGADVVAHPVGTGPYRLKSWRRSSKIVLERNPGYREVLYDGEPNPDDTEAQALLAHFKGRRLPLNDGVEISVLEEGQARWLAFLNGEVDVVRVPSEFTQIGAPLGKLAPNLAKRGITMRRYVNSDFTLTYFNMEDPVVGGYGPAQVALRRAVGLSYDIDREIRIARRGGAIPAQAPMPPGTYGYDPHYRSDNSSHDPARANALLDVYGFVDRDGDGWRERPDGSPLVLQMAGQASQIDRQFNEIWQKSLAAIGVRVAFTTAQWPENMKAARAGKLQMWFLGSTIGADAQDAFAYMYGPQIGSENLARFKLPAFDAVYKRMLDLPDGPERAALFLQASEIVLAYMPYKIHSHRIYTDLSQPWAVGWRQALFRNETWQFAEVDTAMRDRLSR
ncbi:MAG: ABC transporter substrate-binding protein [Burkholderiales bacterium]